MMGGMLMAVAMSLLLLCAGMGAVVLVYLWLIWYVSLHERRHRRQPSEDNGKPRKQRGLSAADLQRLPTIECGKEEEGEERPSGGGGSGNAECAVCLEVFQSGDRCRVIPACSHAFHVQCADPWLSKSSVCPICRRSAACDSEEKDGVNNGTAAVLQEEEGRDHDQESGLRTPAPGSVVVNISIAITPTDHGHC